MMMNTKSNKSYIQKRREGRIIAFQTLFAYNFNSKTLDELFKWDWLIKKYSNESLEYAKFLIKGTIENLNIIDKKIKSKLKNWDFSRISNIDKAILRFSIFSMFFETDLPEKVIINEAVEIVKNFGTEDSYKFINGILDALKRSKNTD